MNKIIRLPDLHESYYQARRVLRSPVAEADQVLAALDVLEHSPEWGDMELCRMMRTALRLNAPKPATRPNIPSDRAFAWIVGRLPDRPPVRQRGPLAPFVVPLVILACLLVATLLIGPAFEAAWTNINASAVGL